MGATYIIVRGAGASMEAAFLGLQEEAISEHGNDSYNGTISTISHYDDKTRDFAASGQEVEEYLEGLMDTLDKRDAVGICMGEPVAGKRGHYIFAGWAAE